jgi:hypothetical protein
MLERILTINGTAATAAISTKRNFIILTGSKSIKMNSRLWILNSEEEVKSTSSPDIRTFIFNPQITMESSHKTPAVEFLPNCGVGRSPLYNFNLD